MILKVRSSLYMYAMDHVHLTLPIILGITIPDQQGRALQHILTLFLSYIHKPSICSIPSQIRPFPELIIFYDTSASAPMMTGASDTIR